MPDSITQDSVPQIANTTASNPFPQMTKEEKIHFVVGKKRKFPRKTFFTIVLLITVIAVISYIVYRNQKGTVSQINDVENPTLQIVSPQNGDTLSGITEIIVYLEDRTFNQKTYKVEGKDFEIANSQTESVTINVGDNLKTATSAQLLYYTTGVTSENQCKVAISNSNFVPCGPTYKTDGKPQEQTLELDVTKLQSGDNIFIWQSAENASPFRIKDPVLAVIFGNLQSVGKVQKVEFLLDNKLVGEKTDFTLPFALDTTKFTNDTHVLLAKAYDEAGNSSFSAPRTITIKN